MALSCDGEGKGLGNALCAVCVGGVSVCVCVCYQCSPRDLWYSAVGSSEINNKQANGQHPAQDGNKHHPAESRHMKILCTPNQNPH